MRNGHEVTRICSGLEDWEIHPLPEAMPARWRMARRNARLRVRRYNLTMDQLVRRAELDPLERAAIGLYAYRYDRISVRAELRAWVRGLWSKRIEPSTARPPQ